MLLQQIDTFQLHLFTAQLTLVKEQQTEANSNRKRMKKSLWTKPWLLRRPLYGQYEKLLHELTAEDSWIQKFSSNEPRKFHELLARVGPKIEKP